MSPRAIQTQTEGQLLPRGVYGLNRQDEEKKGRGSVVISILQMRKQGLKVNRGRYQEGCDLAGHPRRGMSHLPEFQQLGA